MIGLYHLFAILVPLSFLPAAYHGWRKDRMPALTLALIWVPAAVSVVWVAFFLEGGWERSFTATLWVTVAVSSILYAAIASRSLVLRDLVVLFYPYMFWMAVAALIWEHAEPDSVKQASESMDPWFWSHIVTAVLTYSLLTISAVVALGVILKEQALKRKSPGLLSQRLPAVMEAEALQHRLLLVAEVVLALGLMTGMGAQYWQTGSLIVADHKTLLSLFSFIIIGLLLFAGYKFGIRGRRASQTLLLAYLLVSLAYPGVKFVSEILMRQ